MDVVRRASSWDADGPLGSHLPYPERTKGIELCLKDISFFSCLIFKFLINI